jgi:hypothetical protein
MQRLLAPARWLEHHRIGVVACLAVALAAGVVLGQLNAVLAGMHVPGAGSYTISDLTDTRLGIPKAENAADVIRTWRETQIPDGFRGPAWSVGAFALVDGLLFAPAYALLLAIVLLKLRGSVEATSGPDRLNEIASARILRRGEDLNEESFAAEYANVKSLRRTGLRLIGVTLAAVPVLFLLDELENVLIPVVYHETPSGDWFGLLFFLLGWAALLKWALGILIMIGLAVITLAAASLERGRMGRLWTALVVLRAQVILLVLYAAGLFASDQSGDVILRWRDDPIDGLAALALTGAFGVVSLTTARLLLVELRQRDRDVPESRVFAAGVALVVGGVVAESIWQFGEGLAVLGAIVALVIGLSWLVAEPPLRRRQRTVGRFALVFPALLGGIPLVLLGLAALRTSVPEIAYARKSEFVVLAVIGLVVQAVGWTVALRWNRKVAESRLKVVLWAALAFSALLTLRVFLNPWRTSESLGSIGIFAGFTVAATLVAFGLVFFSERYEAPSAFAVLRFRRTPVFLLLAVWALVAAKVDQDGSYYDVRTAPASEQAQSLARQEIAFDRVRPRRRDAFDEWAARRPAAPAVPLVFVSAAGGGIRAGYWVATVLDCVLEGRGDEACSRHGEAANTRANGSVFAASGISGGSVGLAAYVTHLRHDPEDPDWRDERLGDDYIAPMIGWWLFVDAPLSLIRRDGGGDRAEIIERAFERSWVDDIGDRGAAGLIWKRGASTDGTPFSAGIFDLWARAQRREDVSLPLLLLNGTKVQDGCRFNASVFDASVEYRVREGSSAVAARLAEDCLALRLFERTPPDVESIYVKPENRTDWTFASTEDLSDFVCRENDIRLSTAAMLSARFPFALPSGRLEKCRTRRAPAINVVDGGYFDTSGASPIVELWTELEPEVDALNSRAGAPCIVPFFLQIDTGYSDPTGGKRSRPLEMTVPIQTATTARNAREANARQAAALSFSGPFGRIRDATLADGAPLDRFAHIYPRAHPGSKAPLGWTLSRTAREDLDRQLSANRAEIAKVRDWFDGGLRCGGQTQSG